MSSHKRKRARNVETEEHSDSERWLVSYADMLTVLVGLFIVLYAMSQVDQVKYEQLAASLAEGFGGSSQAVLHTGSSILDDNSAIAPVVRPGIDKDLATALRNDKEGETTDSQDQVNKADYQAAVHEYQALDKLAQQLEVRLDENDLGGTVTFRINEQGLVVGLVSDELFFVPDAATLTTTSRKVISTIAPILKKLPNSVSVEGHANTLPSTAYASNWELSADRAVQVLRQFVTAGKFPQQRISATGFGAAQPLKPNDTEAGLRANRRVDIVVLSTQPERIRELIPQVIADLTKK